MKAAEKYFHFKEWLVQDILRTGRYERFYDGELPWPNFGCFCFYCLFVCLTACVLVCIVCVLCVFVCLTACVYCACVYSLCVLLVCLCACVLVCLCINRPKLSKNCAIPQYFHTRKLGEIKVFYEVIWLTNSSCYGSIPLSLRLIGKDGGLSALCHGCGFACQ